MVTFSQLSKLGRLGNQLWQISATIGYARMYGQNYILPNWEYAKHFIGPFNQSATIKPASVYSEKGFHYTKIPKYNNVDLYGYFQSIKYWKHCENEIKKIFSPNETIQGILNKSPIPPNTCAIHIRRTDYVEKYSNYLPPLPLEYYTKGMELMKADNYMIFSDDIEWAKENIKGEKFEYVHSGNDILDWFVMRQCDNFIIANSSYSWWASYLSESKKTIAPAKDRWFGSEGKYNNVDDLYLEKWELV